MQHRMGEMGLLGDHRMRLWKQSVATIYLLGKIWLQTPSLALLSRLNGDTDSGLRTIFPSSRHVAGLPDAM